MVMVQKLQSFITIPIVGGFFDPTKIETTVRTLDVINDVNLMFKKTLQIHYKDFHNDAINKEVRLKDHITSWIKERIKCQEERRVFDRHRIFTLCNYPWILDAEHKIELLAIENDVKHHQEAQRNMHNIMNALLGPAGQPDINPYLILKVSRDNLIPDTLSKLVSGNVNLKKPLKVVF